MIGLCHFFRCVYWSDRIAPPPREVSRGLGQFTAHFSVRVVGVGALTSMPIALSSTNRLSDWLFPDREQQAIYHVVDSSVIEFRFFFPAPTSSARSVVAAFSLARGSVANLRLPIARRQSTGGTHSPNVCVIERRRRRVAADRLIGLKPVTTSDDGVGAIPSRGIASGNGLSPSCCVMISITI